MVILASGIMVLFYLIGGLTLYLLGTIPGAIMFILLQWYYGELAELKPLHPLTETSKIVDVLEAGILAILPHQSSAKQLIDTLIQSPGGIFFMIRFMIPLRELASVVSDEAGSAEPILVAARHLALSHGSELIDSAAITAAVIATTPGIDMLLATLHVSLDDVYDGYDWYLHEQKTFAFVRQQRQYGGIGRDLTFGYTPLLDQLGYNVTAEIERHGAVFRPSPERQIVISHVTSLLTSATRQNIALVGEAGSGRTTLMYALAEQLLSNRLLPSKIRYHQIIGLDAATIIAQARGRGEVEQMLIRIMNEAVKAKNIILFLDDAQLFLQDSTGAVDLSNILLPVLQQGSVRIVLALDESWWQRLTQTNPNIVQLLNRAPVLPLDRHATMAAMEDQLLLLEHRHKVTFTYRSLVEAYNLAERFVQDQVMPGKAISLLEAAATVGGDGLITEQSIQQAIEQRYGVKVQTVNDAAEREKLLNLETLIHERMINQVRAVTRVSDSLRRARAGVRNTQRPVGTFLFLGPTGVGKTELSKSLAAICYGGEDRLIRLDLNEYNTAQDVGRLLASAVTNADGLCAMVAKQPFSVVLLDEIEKAHPSVLSALLQLLDEGILRDSNNRDVNFRETIIIATSNAGADKIRAHIDQGDELDQIEESLVHELIDGGQFKPEFLNRFDEIILFKPLTKVELIAVVDLIMAQMNQTLASQKISVVLEDDAKAWLVDNGYDPRLGARPLRRIIQQTVESSIAKSVLSGTLAAGMTMTFTARDLAADYHK
ncbi:MAG: hypothetical protein NVS1B7_4970 [Candidatus Saccharimonadales bacterium]